MMVILNLKRAWSYFFKIKFSVSFEELSLQRCRLKILVEMVILFGCTEQFWVLQLPIFYYVSLIMVTITTHIFINIFQTKQFSVVKFDMGYEDNISFLVIPNLQKFEKGFKNRTVYL